MARLILATSPGAFQLLPRLAPNAREYPGWMLEFQNRDALGVASK
jgi:hypothetical protein